MPLPRVSPRHVRAASSGEGWSAPRPRSFAWSQLQADQGAHSPVFPHQPPESWLAMREISQPAGSRGSFRRRREMFPDGSIPLQSNAIREEPHPAAHKPYDAEKARLLERESNRLITDKERVSESVCVGQLIKDQPDSMRLKPDFRSSFQNFHHIAYHTIISHQTRHANTQM